MAQKKTMNKEAEDIYQRVLSVREMKCPYKILETRETSVTKYYTKNR